MSYTLPKPKISKMIYILPPTPSASQLSFSDVFSKKIRPLASFETLNWHQIQESFSPFPSETLFLVPKAFEEKIDLFFQPPKRRFLSPFFPSYLFYEPPTSAFSPYLELFHTPPSFLFSIFAQKPMFSFKTSKRFLNVQEVFSWIFSALLASSVNEPPTHTTIHIWLDHLCLLYKYFQSLPISHGTCLLDCSLKKLSLYFFFPLHKTQKIILSPPDFIKGSWFQSQIFSDPKTLFLSFHFFSKALSLKKPLFLWNETTPLSFPKELKKIIFLSKNAFQNTKLFPRPSFKKELIYWKTKAQKQQKMLSLYEDLPQPRFEDLVQSLREKFLLLKKKQNLVRKKHLTAPSSWDTVFLKTLTLEKKWISLLEQTLQEWKKSRSL